MKPDNDTCKCACGYTWKRGFSGHHYCGPQYRAAIASIEAERDAALNTCSLIAEALGITGAIAGDTIARVQQLVTENSVMLKLLTDISENHSEFVDEGDGYMRASIPLDYVSEINMYVSRDVNAENPFPATDAAINEIKARGVMEFATSRAAFLSGYEHAEKFAASLRVNRMSEITNRTDKGEIIICQINDLRLTPKMPRIRSGRTQKFGERIIEGGKLIQECDFSIEPAEKHIYALEVNGIWMWVNGCGHCNQNGEKMSYQVCDEHDRCQLCGIQHKDAIGIPPRSEHDCGGGMWGTVSEDGVWGWTCHPCKEARDAKTKAVALARIPSDEDFEESDFQGQYEAKCPYCSAEVFTGDRYDADRELIECDECGHSFKLTANHETTWTTEREA